MEPSTVDLICISGLQALAYPIGLMLSSFRDRMETIRFDTRVGNRSSRLRSTIHAVITSTKFKRRNVTMPFVECVKAEFLAQSLEINVSKNPRLPSTVLTQVPIVPLNQIKTAVKTPVLDFQMVQTMLLPAGPARRPRAIPYRLVSRRLLRIRP